MNTALETAIRIARRKLDEAASVHADAAARAREARTARGAAERHIVDEVAGAAGDPVLNAGLAPWLGVARARERTLAATEAARDGERQSAQRIVSDRLGRARALECVAERREAEARRRAAARQQARLDEFGARRFQS